MSADYLLGSSDKEILRMEFQHEVWKSVTDAFLDRIGIRQGWRVLDVGAGPGFTTSDLRGRVGDEGHVTALEPATLFADHLERLAKATGWVNVDIVRSTAEQAQLEPASYDLIFVRWVLDFLSDRRTFLATLATAAKKGGMIAVMDYWYEGLSVYPRGTAFDRIPDIARAYYRSGGGYAYAIADMPSILRPMGFEVVETMPLQLSGGNTSGPFRWAAQFFTEHLPLMADKGLISPEERDAQLKNFSHLAQNQDMLFFTPIVLACSMRKCHPGPKSPGVLA